MDVLKVLYFSLCFVVDFIILFILRVLNGSTSNIDRSTIQFIDIEYRTQHKICVGMESCIIFNVMYVYDNTTITTFSRPNCSHKTGRNKVKSNKKQNCSCIKHKHICIECRRNNNSSIELATD